MAEQNAGSHLYMLLQKICDTANHSDAIIRKCLELSTGYISADGRVGQSLFEYSRWASKMSTYSIMLIWQPAANNIGNNDKNSRHIISDILLKS